MNWEILEKVIRYKGNFAHVDVVIHRNGPEEPFIYAVVDENKDKAIVFHAKCDSLEEAKIMAIGSLQAYDAINANVEQNKLLVIEDGLVLVGIRTEHGDRYEPIAGSGTVKFQLSEIIQSATSLFTALSNE